MNRFLISVILLILSFYVYSQENLPSYPVILKAFFSKYEGKDDNDNYTNFAKKKNGWYVQQITGTNQIVY